MVGVLEAPEAGPGAAGCAGPGRASARLAAGRSTVAERVSFGPWTGGSGDDARACDSRSATTIANNPSVTSGRTARFIDLHQRPDRRDRSSALSRTDLP